MLDSSKPVRVFRNWKRGCYSVMQGGIVRLSVREVLLCDVEFVVRESGRRRMRETGVKNVHAYAQGQIVDFVRVADARCLGRLEGRHGGYDALGAATFVDLMTDAPLRSADLTQLDDTGLTYAPYPLPLDAPVLAA